MTLDSWREMATADARRRELPELEPLLETLAKATRTLRAADLTARIEEKATAADSTARPHVDRD
jgi:hypothetical protein